MIQQKILLKSGTLWDKAIQQTELARSTGALQSIATDSEFIEDKDINFIVRISTNLKRKEEAKKKQKKQSKKTGVYFDPFLPYEPDLFVDDLTDTHLCLLNKFNVVSGHLLIVTRDFKPQTNLLNLNDFIALWTCLREVDGLSFYNGGKKAGASQKHKHLQLTPLPLIENTTSIPIQSAINKVTFNNSLGIIPSFSFNHAIAKLNCFDLDNPLQGAKIMLDCYYTLWDKIGLNLDRDTIEQPLAYNFLATRKWMLIVPRSQESFKKISINSLGFAGSLFVKNSDSLQLVKNVLPLTLLNTVAENKIVTQ